MTLNKILQDALDEATFWSLGGTGVHTGMSKEKAKEAIKQWAITLIESEQDEIPDGHTNPAHVCDVCVIRRSRNGKGSELKQKLQEAE